jgi:hypothetical protein
MKRYAIFLLVLCGTGLVSCGSGGAIATSAVTALDADVAKWTGTPCASGSTYTILPDDVNVTLSAFPVATSNNTVNEKVQVLSVDIVYSPANSTSPLLPTQYMALGGIQTDMGGSVTIPVRVAPQDLKGLPLLNSLVCSSTIYSYYVTMTFHCQYLKAGESFDVSAQTNIRFADFVN